MIPDQIVAKLFAELYEQILKKEIDYSINVFLCGSSPDRKASIRKDIYDRIKDLSKFNVVFPEWIFGGLLLNKQYNLLELERELAVDVDVIVLPLEGYGTMTELGSFASFPDLTEKIIVVNEDKYRHNKRSFINIGPIELIRSQDKRNIIYYTDNSRSNMLDDVYGRLRHFRRHHAKKDIKNLFTLSRFLLYVIAIFQPITKEEIEKYSKNWNADVQKDYIDPALEILSRKGNIRTDPWEDQETFRLTSEGHHYVHEEKCRELGIMRLVSEKRSEVLRFQNRKIKAFNMNRERERLLGVS